MYDLIYTENYNDYQEIKKVIENKYSKAKIEDASDQIHEHRFSVEFEIEDDDWFMFTIHKEFAMCSLIFQMVMRRDPDRIKEIINKVTK